MEARKKITFEFVKKNSPIIKENFLIIEINGKTFIGRLSSVTGDWLKLDKGRKFDDLLRGSYPSLIFNQFSIDIFLPTSADIGKLGNEMLIEYNTMINNTIVQPHTVFLEEINQIFSEQEKNEKLVKKFNDFCNENNIDEQDIWAYLNNKSEKER